MAGESELPDRYTLDDPRWTRWFSHDKPPLAADADALRLNVLGERVFPWHTLREVRIERRLLGHRVMVVPHDIEACLVSVGLSPETGPGRMWARKGRIGTGFGNRRIDTDSIVGALAGLAGDRCQVTRS